MGKVEKFEDLHCWQDSRNLTKVVFLECRSGLLAKDYSTKDQIQRAALSVMNNIAEGFSRYHEKEFKHFLDISQSSASEVISMTYLLEDIGYLSSDKAINIRTIAQTTRKKILALIRYLASK